jgi:hypothetical protein
LRPSAAISSGEKGAEEMVDMGALQWATEPYFSGIPGLPDDRKF